jgi:hypothetical protein
MKKKIPAKVLEIARARKKGVKPDERAPLVLSPEGAVVSVINQALQQDAMRIAVSSFLEGRGLEGNWTLRVTGAELVPVK